MSSISTDRYESLQSLLTERCLHYSSFDDRPSRLFDGLEHIRLTIHLIGKKAPKSSALWSTQYNKWSSLERGALFERLRYTSSSQALVSGTLPKLCTELESSIVGKLAQQGSKLADFFVRSGCHKVLYSRKVGYFLQVLDFEPRVLDGRGRKRPPSEFKEVSFGEPSHAKVALCCLNSNLFYWFVTVFSDCRHLNKREVEAFPIDLRRLAESRLCTRLVKLAEELMADIQANSEERTMRFSHDTLTVQCIVPKLSKKIIDAIDGSLAAHYGFSDQELDFLTNYDIKYRIGQEDDGDDGE